MRALSLSIATFISLQAFGPANASEGLAFAAAYECEPLKVTEAVVATCKSVRPELAKALVAALDSWKRRNTVAAIDREKICHAELRSRFASAEEAMKASETLSTQIAVITESLKADIAKHPDSCTSTLQSISSSESDLDHATSRAK